MNNREMRGVAGQEGIEISASNLRFTASSLNLEDEDGGPSGSGGAMIINNPVLGSGSGGGNPISFSGLGINADASKGLVMDVPQTSFTFTSDDVCIDGVPWPNCSLAGDFGTGTYGSVTAQNVQINSPTQIEMKGLGDGLAINGTLDAQADNFRYDDSVGDPDAAGPTPGQIKFGSGSGGQESYGVQLSTSLDGTEIHADEFDGLVMELPTNAGLDAHVDGIYIGVTSAPLGSLKVQGMDFNSSNIALSGQSGLDDGLSVDAELDIFAERVEFQDFETTNSFLKAEDFSISNTSLFAGDFNIDSSDGFVLGAPIGGIDLSTSDICLESSTGSCGSSGTVLGTLSLTQADFFLTEIIANSYFNSSGDDVDGFDLDVNLDLDFDELAYIDRDGYDRDGYDDPTTGNPDHQNDGTQGRLALGSTTISGAFPNVYMNADGLYGLRFRIPDGNMDFSTDNLQLGPSGGIGVAVNGISFSAGANDETIIALDDPSGAVIQPDMELEFDINNIELTDDDGLPNLSNDNAGTVRFGHNGNIDFGQSKANNGVNDPVSFQNISFDMNGQNAVITFPEEAFGIDIEGLAVGSSGGYGNSMGDLSFEDVTLGSNSNIRISGWDDGISAANGDVDVGDNDGTDDGLDIGLLLDTLTMDVRIEDSDGWPFGPGQAGELYANEAEIVLDNGSGGRAQFNMNVDGDRGMVIEATDASVDFEANTIYLGEARSPSTPPSPVHTDMDLDGTRVDVFSR
jgi:hypothetical protein